MAFERAPFENSGEPEPPGPGELWLADVQNVPGFSPSDRYTIDMIKCRATDAFDMQQRRRLQVIRDTNIDIIDEQLETLRQIFGYSPRS